MIVKFVHVRPTETLAYPLLVMTTSVNQANINVGASVGPQPTYSTVADLGGVRGVQMHPPLAASNVFCVHNCTSPSNDYAAVTCSNNNQAQLQLAYQFLIRRLTRPRVASRYSVRPEGSATARLGIRDLEIYWISRGFRISEWISGFRFLDFCRQVSSCMFLDILAIVPSLAKILVSCSFG